jgi:hypothetical protein
MSHPKAHLWQALQRRFAEQNKASTSSDLLIRSLKVMPLNGQESSSSWSLGFMETGAVRRTVSLSKDFIATAALVQPSVPCYLIMFVGDVSQVKLPDPKAQWLLVSYVPAAASPLLMKQMADNRAGLKAVLGESSFAGDLWCTTADQITLSNYIRVSAQGGGLQPPTTSAEGTNSAAAKIQSRYRQSRRGGPTVSIQAQAAATAATIATTAAGVSADRALWDQRMKGTATPTHPHPQPMAHRTMAMGMPSLARTRLAPAGVRSSYYDSCKRLAGSLDELEQTLCSLLGEEYKADQPLLHARAHMHKEIALAQASKSI